MRRAPRARRLTLLLAMCATALAGAAAWQQLPVIAADSGPQAWPGGDITYWDGAGLILGAQSGQVTVQKVDDQFIEGTFNFDAEKDGKKVICTDGQFRIPAPLPAK